MPTPSESRPVAGRFLLLGVGSIGMRHARNLRAAGVGDIFAYDPSHERLAAARAELGVPGFGDLAEAWAVLPDAVFITSPTALHIPQALEAARRGCHLFIEKPLSHSSEGVSELLAEAEARSLVTMVGCNMRFHPGPATVRRLVAEGAVGPILSARVFTGSYLPRWRPQQDYTKSYSASVESGGALLDCIHEVDLALWYLGPATLVASVVRPATSIGLSADGLAELLLAHESGAISSVHLNFVQRDYYRGCTLVGERGTIRWEFAEGAVRVCGEDGQLRETLPEPAGWEMNQMYTDELGHFLASLRSGSQTANPLPEAARTLALTLEARGASAGAPP